MDFETYKEIVAHMVHNMSSHLSESKTFIVSLMDDALKKLHDGEFEDLVEVESYIINKQEEYLQKYK